MNIKLIFQRIAARGLLKTLQLLPTLAHNTWYHWVDSSLDRKYGIDTQGIIDDMTALEAPPASSIHANGYEGIQIPVLKRIFKDLDINPGEFTFIDFGSGKGRACIMAAEQGFAKTIGVEFSLPLHMIAKRNVETYLKQRPLGNAIELHLQDATTFIVPDGNLICFFYNPFDEIAIMKAIDNIVTAFRTYQKSIFIVYRNAVHAAAFDAHDNLLFVRANRDYRLYRVR